MPERNQDSGYLINRNQYIPDKGGRFNDGKGETVVWDDLDSQETTPQCTAHHDWVQTVSCPDAGVWVCPSCGRVSDSCWRYNRKYRLTTSSGFDVEDLIVIFGEATVPPSDDEEVFGDGTIDAVLVATPYEAREDVLEYKSEKEWPQPSRRFRRWVPEWKVWAVHQPGRHAFADHLLDRGWVVIDIPETRRKSASESR